MTGVHRSTSLDRMRRTSSGAESGCGSNPDSRRNVRNAFPAMTARLALASRLTISGLVFAGANTPWKPSQIRFSNPSSPARQCSGIFADLSAARRPKDNKARTSSAVPSEPVRSASFWTMRRNSTACGGRHARRSWTGICRTTSSTSARASSRGPSLRRPAPPAARALSR